MIKLSTGNCFVTFPHCLKSSVVILIVLKLLPSFWIRGDPTLDGNDWQGPTKEVSDDVKDSSVAVLIRASQKNWNFQC